jgi:hypothetical protein
MCYAATILNFGATRVGRLTCSALLLTTDALCAVSFMSLQGQLEYLYEDSHKKQRSMASRLIYGAGVGWFMGECACRMRVKVQPTSACSHS